MSSYAKSRFWPGQVPYLELFQMLLEALVELSSITGLYYRHQFEEYDFCLLFRRIHRLNFEPRAYITNKCRTTCLMTGSHLSCEYRRASLHIGIPSGGTACFNRSLRDFLRMMITEGKSRAPSILDVRSQANMHVSPPIP